MDADEPLIARCPARAVSDMPRCACFVPRTTGAVCRFYRDDIDGSCDHPVINSVRLKKEEPS